MTTTLTLTDLDAQRSKILSRINKLNDRRSKVAAKLAAIDAEIVALGGVAGGNSTAMPAKKRGRPAKTAKVAKKATSKATKTVKVTAKRAKNDKPLHAYITEVLSGKNLSVKDVASAVKTAGFKTSNPNGLYSQVAVALADDSKFTKVSRGVYTAVAVKTAPTTVNTVAAPVAENTVTETPAVPTTNA